MGPVCVSSDHCTFELLSTARRAIGVDRNASFAEYKTRLQIEDKISCPPKRSYAPPIALAFKRNRMLSRPRVDRFSPIPRIKAPAKGVGKMTTSPGYFRLLNQTYALLEEVLYG